MVTLDAKVLKTKMLDELVCNKKVNVLENRMHKVVYSRESLQMERVTYSRLLLYV